MKKIDNTNYEVGTAETMFDCVATGVGSEWAKRVGIKYSYTIELRDNGRFGFLLPVDFIQKTAQEGQAFVWTVAQAISNETNN